VTIFGTGIDDVPGFAVAHDPQLEIEDISHPVSIPGECNSPKLFVASRPERRMSGSAHRHRAGGSVAKLTTWPIQGLFVPRLSGRSDHGDYVDHPSPAMAAQSSVYTFRAATAAMRAAQIQRLPILPATPAMRAALR
jgi:hypothetical protein